MTALVIVAVVVVMVATAATIRRHADRVIDEILAAELRQIDRERVAQQHAANTQARWQG